MHTYSIAQHKLDTHFGLPASVHRFYSNHLSKLACYLHVSLVALLMINTILPSQLNGHKSSYDSLNLPMSSL